MKYTNFKTVALMLSATVLLALSGCDGTTGITSNSGIGTVPMVTPPPVTPPPVVVPVPDTVTSTVTATPVIVAADGTETSTVTVTVNDANSDPVTDATVSLAQTGTSTISAVTNVGDGTYTFNVKSTTAETVTYTATADGVAITQTADVTFTQTEAQCLFAAGGYETIVINSRTWLDRNLGASEFANATDDTAAYGDSYQWGRSAEGHQERTSDTNDTLATTLDGSDVNTDWYGKFIVNNTAPRDWLETAVDDDGSLRSQSWSTPYDATSNPNQVCPCGYIVPTEQDFVDLNITATNSFGLAYSGWRDYRDGVIKEVSTTAFYWTSDPDNKGGSTSYNLIDDKLGDNDRAYGLPIRCIKP